MRMVFDHVSSSCPWCLWLKRWNYHLRSTPLKACLRMCLYRFANRRFCVCYGMGPRHNFFFGWKIWHLIRKRRERETNAKNKANTWLLVNTWTERSSSNSVGARARDKKRSEVKRANETEISKSLQKNQQQIRLCTRVITYRVEQQWWWQHTRRHYSLTNTDTAHPNTLTHTRGVSLDNGVTCEYVLPCDLSTAFRVL